MGVSVNVTEMKEKAINPETGREVKKWRVMINLGRDPEADPETVKYRVVKRIITGGSKAEAVQAGLKEARRLEGISDLKGAKTPFRTYAEHWLQTRKESGELEAATLDSYAGAVRDLCAALGDKTLEALDVPTVERGLSKIRAAKREKLGKEPSPRTMQVLYITLGQILQRAEDAGYITRNPCSKIKKPRAKESTRRALTAAQAARLLELVEEAEARGYEAYGAKEMRLKQTGHHNKPRSSVRGLIAISYPLGVRLALATGMRLGEILGLQWRDISLSKATVTVERSLGRHDVLKAPKTAAGRRVVAIDAQTVQALSIWADFLRDVLASLGAIGKGEPLPGDLPVICSNSLTHVSGSPFSGWFRQWMDSNGFEGWTMHELRHTHATQLVGNGVDLKTVQSRLGHSTPNITLALYTHALPENDRRASDLFAATVAKAREEVEGAPRLQAL